MRRGNSFPRNRHRGMIGFAVLLLAGVVIMIFTMSFFVTWANYQSSLAFDSYHSQLVEMAGLQQVVQESMLAICSTAPVNSADSIYIEINNRLSAMSFAAGVSISLKAASSLPVNNFYPFVPLHSVPPASILPLFSSSTTQPGIAGSGNRALFFLARGPDTDLGADPAGVAPYEHSVYSFSRTVNNSPAENCIITVLARSFSVPVTNIDCIAYGLPSSGTVAQSDPVMPSGFFSNGFSRLVATLNDPSKDATFYPDLFDPNNAGSLGYQWENNVLFSWDTFEYIWGNTYQNAVLTAAGPAGTFDFDAQLHPPITGVSSSSSAVTVDLSSVTVTTLAVVDGVGAGRTIQILGSPAGNILNAQPLLLYLKSTGMIPTSVDISGNNNRPIILLSRQCSLTFTGNPQFQGAIFLDRNSTATGAATLFGHLSFYCAASPFPAWNNLTMIDSPNVRTALAQLSPRVLLVTTTASR